MCIHDSGGGAEGVVEWCLGPPKKYPRVNAPSENIFGESKLFRKRLLKLMRLILMKFNHKYHIR